MKQRDRLIFFCMGRIQFFFFTLKLNLIFDGVVDLDQYRAELLVGLQKISCCTSESIRQMQEGLSGIITNDIGSAKIKV